MIKHNILVMGAGEIGNSVDSTNHIGPLIDNSAVMLYQHAIDQVKQQNGKIIFGGNVINKNGYLFARRYVDAKGKLYQGFIAASADKIFESTDIKR